MEYVDSTLDTYANIALACGSSLAEKRLAMLSIFEGNAAHFLDSQGR